MPFSLRIVRGLSACLLASALPLTVACHSEGITDPPVAPLGPPGISFMAGATGTDTVMAPMSQALIVQVHDADGHEAPNTVVRFESMPASGNVSEIYSARLDGDIGTLTVDTTDGSGTVAAIVKLGTRAGVGRLIVRVPTLGYVDTAKFTVQPGNARTVVFSSRDISILAGATYNIAAATRDAWGNPRPGDVPVYAVTGSAATVDGAGAVTGQTPGLAWITATFGKLADSAHVTVLPDFVLNVVYQSSTGTSVALMHTDGSSLNRLTNVNASVPLPTTNAAGTLSVFFDADPTLGAGIFVVDDQKVRRMLIGNSATMGIPSGGRISADGVWVYFTVSLPYDYTGTANGTRLWRVHSDGTGLEQLTTGTGTLNHGMPSPSPDGAKVVFVSSGVISVLDLATRAITALPLSGALPRYSPDGTRITYVSQNGLFVANADGSGAARLTPSTRYYDTYATPDWSPDGKWIVARGAGLELWRVADATLFLLPNSSSSYQPSFRPQ